MRSGIGRYWVRARSRTRRSGNVPGDGPAKSSIIDRLRTGMPSEKNLDLDVIAPRQPPIKRHGVLDRMRNHKSNALAHCHSISIEPFSGDRIAFTAMLLRRAGCVSGYSVEDRALRFGQRLGRPRFDCGVNCCRIEVAARSHAIPSRRSGCGIEARQDCRQNVARKTFGNRRAISTAGLRRWNSARMGFRVCRRTAWTACSRRGPADEEERRRSRHKARWSGNRPRVRFADQLLHAVGARRRSTSL